MSKWGSWVSGAVAGIENSLDRVLAEDEQASVKKRAAEAAAKETAKAQKETTGAMTLEQPKAEPGMSRNASRTRQNGRLQERLAKALVNKDVRSPSRASTDGPSRTVSPATVDTTRSSLDSKASEANVDTPSGVQQELPKDEEKAATDVPTPTEEAPKAIDTSPTDPSIPIITTQEPDPRTSNDSTAPSRQSIEDANPPTPSIEDLVKPQESSLPPRPKSPQTLENELSTLQSTHTETLEEHRTEINSHLERIDALQSKLKYLSDQLAASAKATAEAAPASSPEKKLAEKENQIAELMKEGENLSKKELQHSSVIKKLRLKIGENDREIAEFKRRLSKAEQSTSEERERAKRAENAEKAAQEKLKIVARIEKDVVEIKREKEQAAVTISELRRQLSDTATRAEQAEKKAQSGALEAERRVVAELRDELDDSKIERKLAEDRSKAEVRDIKEEAARQAERAKVTEMELKGEVANLETKLEVLRSRTEEVSSSGDSQTKLLRQIETLQTQYALASENWQGIESTLTSRVVALEKERDDVSKRESEIRRKAREVNSKARRLEDVLEAVQDRAKALEQDIQEQRNAAQRLESKATQASNDLKDAQSDFDRQKKVWDTELNQRLEMEKAKWKSELSNHQTPTDSSFLRAESPNVPGSFRKASHSELAGLGLSGIHTRRIMNRTTSGLPTSSDLISPKSERTESRRNSTLPSRTPDLDTPKRQNSTPSLYQLNGGGASQAPSIHAILDDDAYETTSSPRPTINDVISASTTSAGPSVQLVERMSAAVRRLESEKAGTKEEMARMVAQRDEARNEVVELMREVEEKRAADERVTRLEAELKKVDARYQTTLEMLGEKSERVDELVNDVQDLKKIYRDLVERTMTR